MSTPATQMTVTAANVIMGPCISFTVDGQEVGGTSGGVNVEFKQTTQELTVDQVIDAVGIKPTKNEFTVTTTLSEVTLANVQLAFNQANAPTVDAQTGDTTLNLGLNTSLPTHQLVFVGPAPGGGQRTYTINTAVQIASVQSSMALNKQDGLAVSFRCLPDLTQEPGSEYGTVADTTTN